MLVAVATALALSGCQSGGDGGVRHVAGFGDSKPLPGATSAPPNRHHGDAPSRPRPSPAGQRVDGAALDRAAALVQRQVRAVFGTNGMYSALNVIARHPDGLEFEYVFRQTPAITGGTADAYFASKLTQLQAAVDENVAPDLRKIGIQRPVVTYTYRNPDHSLIWTHRFYAS